MIAMGRHEPRRRLVTSWYEERDKRTGEEPAEDSADKQPAVLPQKPHVCHRVSATLWRVLGSTLNGKIVFRQLRHRLPNGSTGTEVHGRPPFAAGASAVAGGEDQNSLCGS